MRVFVNENAVKAKESFQVCSGPRWGSFQRSLNPLADVIGCNSCRVQTVFFRNSFRVNVIHWKNFSWYQLSLSRKNFA